MVRRIVHYQEDPIGAEGGQPTVPQTGVAGQAAAAKYEDHRK